MSDAEQSERDDRLELKGRIVECLPASEFNVRIEPGGHVAIAKLSGRMRQHKIRLVLGDDVLLEVSPYDLTRGRITRRL